MKKIVIIGAGFAGLYSALAAARLRDAVQAEFDLEIVVVAPEAVLNVRPRLYENEPLRMSAPLKDLFGITGVRFVAGFVRTISNADRTIVVDRVGGGEETISYDRLILAAGSRVVRPPIPGLTNHSFSVDQRHEAQELWEHVHSLASQPASAERDTVVIAGGGFTGIERRPRCHIGSGTRWARTPMSV